MNEGLIHKTVQRSNIMLLGLSLLGLAIVGGLVLFNLNFIYNFILGPFEADNTALVNATSASAVQKYWIKISGDEILETGMDYVSTSHNVETVEASYLALALGERLLLVKMPGEQYSETLNPSLTGWLSPISADENKEVLLKLEQDVPGVKAAFLPFKLETGDFRSTGAVGILIAAGVLILAVIGLVMALRRMSDPNSHPILKRLSRFGPLDFTVSRIEAELAAPHPTLRAGTGKLNLTNSWLVYETLTNVLATRFEDIAWVYKHVFNYRQYFITVSRTFSAMVCDRSGARMQVTVGGKEPPADEMLKAILERAPWAVVGYSDDLNRAWNTNRPAFLAAVDQRRTQQDA